MEKQERTNGTLLIRVINCPTPAQRTVLTTDLSLRVSYYRNNSPVRIILKLWITVRFFVKEINNRTQPMMWIEPFLLLPHVASLQSP